MASRRKRNTSYSQETFAETTISSEQHRIRHHWRIHDQHVISRKYHAGQQIDGVRFGGPEVGHVWWRLEFYPHGEDETEADDYASIFLHCQAEGVAQPTGGRFLVALLDHRGNRVAHSAEEPYAAESGAKGWVWPKFCPSALIENEKSIDLIAEIEFYGGEPIVSTNAVPDLPALSHEKIPVLRQQ